MTTAAEQAAQDPSSQQTVEVEPRERLQHWADALGTTPEALLSAVHAVGPRIDRVKDHLTAGGAGGQADA